ncbi:MAG TPA: hypothetical protein VMY37_02015 [Thermoguttaceae bacterium]|nr:hypothetical protein [Thermoguttaceae bacterium]
MSCKILLAPVVFWVAFVLSVGPADWGTNALWGAEKDKDPFARRASPGPKKPKQAAAAGEKASPRRAPALRFGTEAILKVLEEPTSLEVIETPLCEVLAHIQSEHGVHVYLDLRALDDVGVPTDTPMTFAMSGIPLRSALELMLGELDLTWTIRSDVLLITTPEEAETLLVTKTYDVSDLLASARDYSYQGGRLPTTPQENRWLGGGMMPMQGSGGLMSSGGGMAVSGAMSGGAMFAVDSGATSGGAMSAGGGMGGLWPSGSLIAGNDFVQLPDFDSLIDLITTTVAPESWDDVGGAGSCAPYDQVLAISQTIAIHLEIEAFLDSVRAQRQALPTVVVDARWLVLDSDLLDQLLGDRKPRDADAAQVAVDPEALDLLTRTVPGYRARINCVSGHRAYLAAGDRRTVVHGAIPVVGSGVGYQPVMQIPNVGLVLEIRPTVDLGAKSALVDVQSTVTRWRKPDRVLRVGTRFPPSEIGYSYDGEKETVEEPGGESSVDVDRVNLPTQQFAASMRVPLGKPVLVGGLTLSPTTDADGHQAGEERKQLYLVVRTSRVAEER